jgi:hypothetical protein
MPPPLSFLIFRGEEFCVVIQSAMDMEAAIGTKSINT